VKAVERFVVDRSRRDGRASRCRTCDRALSRLYYAMHRELVLAKAAARRPAPVERLCPECGDPFTGNARKVTCGANRCRDARARRLNPEAFAAREAAKVVARREARRRAREEAAG
jgi:hypothetical protein